jgi:hypothetical protein
LRIDQDRIGARRPDFPQAVADERLLGVDTLLGKKRVRADLPENKVGLFFRELLIETAVLNRRRRRD